MPSRTPPGPPAPASGPASPGPASPRPAGPDPAALRTAIAVLVGGIAVILDSTIVSVALDDLARDLRSGVDTIQWVSTGYLLALGVVIPTVGWLQGRLGAKRLWLWSLAVFLLGSVLCAAAWDVPSLIGFRVLQGLGGGAMMPLMTTMVMQSAPAAQARRLMATIALPAAVGPILGPVIGGLILGAGSWRWLFLVNVPLCLAGLALAVRLIPADRPQRRGGRLDLLGFLLLAPALVALLWGLSNVTGDGGFGRPRVIAPLVAGALLLAVFSVRAVRQRGDALVDLHVLRSRPTWAATSLLFLTGASLYGAMLLLPLYWQQLREASALAAGLYLIPQGVGSLLSRGVAPSLTEKTGERWVTVIGFALVGAATVPFAFADAHTPTWPLMIALLVRGLGLGIVVIPLMTVAFRGLGHAQVPHASIVTRIAQQIGGSVGVALFAVILAGAAHGSGSLADAFATAFWWATGFTALAVALSFVLPGKERTADAGSGPEDAGRPEDGRSRPEDAGRPEDAPSAGVLPRGGGATAREEAAGSPSAG